MTNRGELLLVLLVGIASVVAEETATTEELPKDVSEARGRRKFYKFLFKALTPMISSLSTVLLIKTKIVLVGLFLAGIYFFGGKIWPGGFCGHSIVSDVPPPYLSDGITGYHASGPEFISSYPGPEPWSSGSYSGAYSDSYPGSYSGSYPGPSFSPAGAVGASPPSNAYLPPTGSSPVIAGTKRRGKRSADDEELQENEMYWTDQLTDMGFRFLGVTSRICRKRFVCEFDFQARQNPILLFATRAMGRDIFHNYRDAADERARSYQDCGRIFAECGVPKRVNRPHRRRGHLPVTTTTTEEPAASEEEGQLTSEEMHDEGINEIGNGIDLGEDVQTERSFPAGAFHESDWQPIVSQPLLGKLILRRTGAGQ
ncbi:hypothetical protein pipiens_019653 [Culex pipiens pipiens]|uniref:Uncharacterized protein n=1 Tax=Culex pipiens pipiens TaxID=38569 RepID=A0ABD1DT14_CULPP